MRSPQRRADEPLRRVSQLPDGTDRPLRSLLMGVAVDHLGPADVAALGSRVTASVAAAVMTPEAVLSEVLTALVADGHVLIEDHPGVGKTALARALARSIDADYARIQCTSDLLPSDVVGATVFNQLDASFQFRPGPVFAHLVLVDEINRASPKTQSGLLECMQEGHVTADGESHPLPRPFMVIATQNPVEYEGTYPLPEAQLDRFMVRVSLGYPPAAQEAEMLSAHASRDRVLDIVPVTSIEEVLRAQQAAVAVHASEALRDYVVALLAYTRTDPRVELGASPRAGLMLLKAAKASAALDGRDHVLPDDVQQLAPSVLAHRLLVAPSAFGTPRSEVVGDALAAVRAL
jgi:MoxR-like ATPase